MNIGKGLAEVGAGIAVLGIAFALSQCQQNEDNQNTQRMKICLDHGGSWQTTPPACTIGGK